MSKKLFTEDQPEPVDAAKIEPESEAVKLRAGELSAGEIAEVELEAQAEVAKEAKAAARKALKAKLLHEAKQAEGLEEATEEIVIELAPYCADIRIDNRVYRQGEYVTVPVSRAQVMREIMQNTWKHQSIVDGKSENFYRRTRGARVIPNGNGAAVVNSSNLLRA